MLGRGILVPLITFGCCSSFLAIEDDISLSTLRTLTFCDIETWPMVFMAGFRVVRLFARERDYA